MTNDRIRQWILKMTFLTMMVQRILPPSGAAQDLHYQTVTSGTLPEEAARSAQQEMPASLNDLLLRRLGLGPPFRGLEKRAQPTCTVPCHAACVKCPMCGPTLPASHSAFSCSSSHQPCSTSSGVQLGASGLLPQFQARFSPSFVMEGSWYQAQSSDFWGCKVAANFAESSAKVGSQRTNEGVTPLA